MASHNKKYDNNNAEVIIALKDKAGHIHELEDRYIRERFDDEVRTRENLFNTLSTMLQNLYDEDDRIEGKFDGVIKDKLQDYFVFLGTFDKSSGGENAASNISNLNLSHSTILLYIYETNKVGIVYNFLRNDGFFQLLEMKGSKFFRYFKWNTDKSALTLQNTFEGANIKAGWNNYTSKLFFEIGNKNSGTPYLNIFPLHAGGIVSYNIETLINLVDKYSLYSENGSTKFTTEEIQNWSMPDSPTLLNIIKNLYEKNNTYKSLLTSATNTITALRTDLNTANSKLAQVSIAQYNDKLQQDLTIQGLNQAYQYLQEQLEANFKQDNQRYSEQTGIDKRQDEIINELLSYHTETISRGTPTQTQDISSNVLGMIEIPYNSEYMYIYDTNNENNISDDTLLVNVQYLNDVLRLYNPNIIDGGDISNNISIVGNGKLILFRVIYNDNHYYYYYQDWFEKPEVLGSPWPSGNDSNWISFKSLNANSTIAQLYYGTWPISWGSTPQTIPQYSAQSTSVNTATESQAPTGTQAQTTPTQTINTKTLPISGAPVTPGRPTETEVQILTGTQTQTTHTQAITLGTTIGPTIATGTHTQTTPTQAITLGTTIGPTIAPTGRPAGYTLPSDSGYQYVYEGMTGVNISESSVDVNPDIYSDLPKDLILIKHSDGSYEYCDFIGICPDGILSGYYTYNKRISDTSNIVTEAPQS